MGDIYSDFSLSDTDDDEPRWREHDGYTVSGTVTDSSISDSDESVIYVPQPKGEVTIWYVIELVFIFYNTLICLLNCRTNSVGHILMSVILKHACVIRSFQIVCSIWV